jgi:hypothetical protein
VSVFLVRQNRSFRRDIAQLHERLARLETVHGENDESRVRLSRQRAADWEVATLREQAGEVFRLRAQRGELLRLRRENQEAALQAAQLTNQLLQLARQNDELRQAQNMTPRTWSVADGDGLAIPIQTHWADADSITVSNILRFLDRDAITRRGPAASNPEVPPPSVHAQPNQSCVSCHTEPAQPQGNLKPQMLGLIGFQP